MGLKSDGNFDLMEGYVAFNLFRSSGEILKTIHYKVEGDMFTVLYDGISRTRKIIECREFTYTVQKTQVKAIDGVKGFVGFIERANFSDCWNSHVYSLLRKMAQN